MIDDINDRDARHIVTVEDPIEYDHAHRRSVVEQIEVGSEATDASAALRRMTDSFPAEQQNAARQRLATPLAAVLTQTLIPRPLGTRCERGAPSRAPS